jgi:hypothetical protein
VVPANYPRMKLMPKRQLSVKIYVCPFSIPFYYFL